MVDVPEGDAHHLSITIQNSQIKLPFYKTDLPVFKACQILWCSLQC